MRRVLFYVQHLLGIGHLARASRVASALAADGFDVTVVTGGMPVAGFPTAGVGHVALPPITARDEGFSGLATATGEPVDKAFEAMRRDLLLDLLQRLSPDILIVEAFPFGRRQVRFELLPLLEAAAQRRPKPLVVTSVRDILQERSKAGRNEETVELLNRYFDLVLVHGDPDFIRLEETFPLAAAIKPPVAYTGLVAPQVPTPALDHFDIVVSAGGGAAGRDLVMAAVEAATICGPGRRWLLIAGPNLAAADYTAASAAVPAHMTIERFRTDFPNILAAAGLSVSQAGYNTVCDILVAGCRAVLVPFAAGGETEQTVRAERLAARGLATVLPERGISGKTLAAAIGTALAAPPPKPFSPALDGAQRTASLLAGSFSSSIGVGA